MLATSMLASPLTSHAQQAPVHSASISGQEIVNPNYEDFGVIPGGDVHRKQVVRSGAANASDNRLAVTIYGVQRGTPQAAQALEMVRLSIIEAQKDGTEVVLVLGTSDPAQFDVGEYRSTANPIHVEIHENGGLVNTGDYFLTPYILHPVDGKLMLNTNFGQQMDDALDLAKSRLEISLTEERRVAMAGGPAVSFPE